MRRRAKFDGDHGSKPGAAAEKRFSARVMRSEPTPGEAALWARLQGRALSGWRFRRQHVIAGYIVDFYCPKLWLAIEVDGPIHDVQREQDERRDLHLAALGVHVLRIRDENIQANLIDVLRAISARCEGLAINANVHAYGGRTSKR